MIGLKPCIRSRDMVNTLQAVFIDTVMEHIEKEIERKTDYIIGM